MEAVLAVWGAAVSTVLAVREALKWWRDRPIIDVDARLVRIALASEGATNHPRQVAIVNERGIPEGVSLGFSITNSGNQAVQIVSLFFEGPTNEVQVTPADLPAVLEPRTGVSLEVQPEWISFFNPSKLGRVGALDALGTKHAITAASLQSLTVGVAGLPTRSATYKRKNDADTLLEPMVEAFQAFDRAVIVRRR